MRPMTAQMREALEYLATHGPVTWHPGVSGPREAGLHLYRASIKGLVRRRLARQFLSTVEITETGRKELKREGQ